MSGQIISDETRQFPPVPGGEAEEQNVVPERRQENAEFLFTSAHCGVRAQGVFEQLHLPVRTPRRHSRGAGCQLADAGSCDEVFHRQLREAFARARASGIANPIAIGAIPFDLSEPCHLAIPRSYTVYSRELELKNSAGPGAVRAANTEPAKVLASKSVPEKARFKQAVQQAIANFQLSDIRKAVLSRVLDVELDRPLDLDGFFARLMEQNPAAYHFSLPLVDGSQMIGASPELLLRRQGEHVYSNPLAGSARRRACADEDRRVSEALTQSQKDAYEHRLVIEDIRAQLAPLCRELTVPDGPQLMHTRAMWHLSTPIEGVLQDPSLSALQVACRLHPTPALCGFPTRQARKLIQLVEPFERGLFGGIVGWCDAEGNGEWAVAIRCGIFSGNRAQLFAGAGIVEDSDPESEWQETRAKLQTMLQALDIEIDAEPGDPAAQESGSENRSHKAVRVRRTSEQEEVLPS